MWIRTLLFKPIPVAIISGIIVHRENKENRENKETRTDRHISYILKENKFGDKQCIFINYFSYLLHSKQHPLYINYIFPWLNNAKEIKDFNLPEEILEICK